MSAPALGGVATGVGSLPGEDIDEAVALVFDALPDLPHLPELPARGAGADLLGRAAAQLVDLHVDLQPSGWRLVDRPSGDERRAAALLAADLDALVPVAAGYDGTFKTQLAGPWTLAAALQLPRGGAVLRDRGAVRDVVASLAETVVAHLDDVRRRLPAARLVLQLDEPALPGVLAGDVPTESGLHRLPPVDAVEVTAALRQVVAAAGVPVAVHCCAARPPVALLHDAGASAVSVDQAIAHLDRDLLAERVEQGLVLWLGVVPGRGPGVPPAVRDVLTPARRLWTELGLGADRLAERVTLTPACGLAGASDGWARTALQLVRQAARALPDAAGARA